MGLEAIRRERDHSLCILSGASDREPACQCRRHKKCRFDPWVGGGLGNPIHPSIIAQRILWTEEPGGLRSVGSQSWTLKQLSSSRAAVQKQKGGIRPQARKRVPPEPDSACTLILDFPPLELSGNEFQAKAFKKTKKKRRGKKKSLKTQQLVTTIWGRRVGRWVGFVADQIQLVLLFRIFQAVSDLTKTISHSLSFSFKLFLHRWSHLKKCSVALPCLGLPSGSVVKNLPAVQET